MSQRARATSGAAPRTSDFERAVRRLATIIGHGDQGLALARTLAREGARTRADLKKPQVLARLPSESRASVLYNPARNIPLATARAVAAELKRRLAFALDAPGVLKGLRFEVIPVGSVRRERPRAKDLDFLAVVPPQHEALLDTALAAAALRAPRAGDRLAFADTYASGPRRRGLIVRYATPGRVRPQHFRVDLFLTTSAERPYALFHYTGDFAYNIRTRAHAKRQGWLLNQYGLFDAGTNQRVRGSTAIRSERDLARFLGVTYHPPRDRNEDNAARPREPPPRRREPRPKK